MIASLLLGVILAGLSSALKPRSFSVTTVLFRIPGGEYGLLPPPGDYIACYWYRRDRGQTWMYTGNDDGGNRRVYVTSRCMLYIGRMTPDDLRTYTCVALSTHRDRPSIRKHVTLTLQRRKRTREMNYHHIEL